VTWIYESQTSIVAQDMQAYQLNIVKLLSYVNILACQSSGEKFWSIV